MSFLGGHPALCLVSLLSRRILQLLAGWPAGRSGGHGPLDGAGLVFLHSAAIFIRGAKPDGLRLDRDVRGHGRAFQPHP